MSATSVRVDLTDLDAFMAGEHYAMFDWLRQHDPVHWQESDAGGFWALTRYADVVEAYRRYEVFSSTNGVMLGGSYNDEADTSAGGMLVSSDPPQQRQLRQAIHRAFAPEVLDRVSACVRTLVDAALDRLVREGGGDFAMDVARELPTGALMGIMALGHSDAYHLIRLTHDMIDYRNPELGGDEGARLRLADIQAEIFDFFATLISERSASPGDDLVGILLSADINGRGIQLEEILYNCLNVAVGGNTTSVYSSCAGVIAFAEHRDQYARLLADPTVVPTAVDEVLRWSTPNAYDNRVAREDYEMGGKTIAAGNSVTLWIASANRDPDQFAQPDRFLVDRRPNRHLAFGSGIHRCIGMRFAQAELNILFAKMAARGVEVEVAGTRNPIRSNFMQGYRHLPVTVLDAR